MATRLTSADTFRAVAARYQNRANETTTPALRNAYRQLAMGYVRLAEQQEAVDRGHALIGKLHADDIAMDAHPSGRPTKGRDDNSPLKDEIAINQSMKAILQHAPEMEAIGLLTARIAHDFNNLLMAVGRSAELIADGLGPDAVSLPHIATIIGAVKRGATLTGQLLTFGRKQTPVPRSADYLPKVSNDTAPTQEIRRLPSRPVLAAPLFNSSNQGRRILVLDDDNEVLETVTDMLIGAGYTVVPFGMASHALDEVNGPRQIDLMVVNFAMPGMRGDRFATKARLQRSAVPILFISGYTEPASLQSEPFLLRKPFSVTSLISTIEEAMHVAA
jgi:CheY-like chemotaxis protein